MRSSIEKRSHSVGVVGLQKLVVQLCYRVELLPSQRIFGGVQAHKLTTEFTLVIKLLTD